MTGSTQTWVNGEALDRETIEISLDSDSLQFGRGLFETVSLRSGRLLFWDLHMERLARGVDLVGFDSRIIDDISDLIVQLPGLDLSGELRLKVLLLHDGESDRPIVVVRTSPGPERGRSLVDLFLSDAERSVPPGGERVKATSYLDEWIVQHEAQRRGMFDGIFSFRGDWLSEGSRSNLFFVQEGEIRTPSSRSGLLEGVGREAILIGAEKRGLAICTGIYRVDSLRVATDVAIVSALRGVMPVGSIVDNDNEPVWSRGENSVDSLTGLLSELYDSVAEETSLDLREPE